MSTSLQTDQPLGLIAGNGRFPFLVLDAARSQGLHVVVAAIREETDPALEARAAQMGGRTQWLSLGQLGKLIEFFQAAGVRQALMAGQVKHKQIFSRLRPDWRMVKLLASLATKNTDGLLGAVVNCLQAEGIELIHSTVLLQPLLATEGPLTARALNEQERANADYGLRVARHLAAMDIGQTVVISDSACVAAEAMEGTDATIRRAGTLVEGHPLTVVKVAKPKQDLRFDVPVIGPASIAAMRDAGATALIVEAGITLLIDREELVQKATQADIAIEGVARLSPQAAPAASGAQP